VEVGYRFRLLSKEPYGYFAFRDFLSGTQYHCPATGYRMIQDMIALPAAEEPVP
jgi:hypothetical protein